MLKICNLLQQLYRSTTPIRRIRYFQQVSIQAYGATVLNLYCLHKDLEPIQSSHNLLQAETRRLRRYRFNNIMRCIRFKPHLPTSRTTYLTPNSQKISLKEEKQTHADIGIIVLFFFIKGNQINAISIMESKISTYNSIYRITEKPNETHQRHGFTERRAALIKDLITENKDHTISKHPELKNKNKKALKMHASINANRRAERVIENVKWKSHYSAGALPKHKCCDCCWVEQN